MNPASTILAVASPSGSSLRGVIRISGVETFALLEPHLVLRRIDRDRRDDASGAMSRASPGLHSARLHLPPLPPLSALALRFAAPRSYTAEDAVELQLPGNPVLLERVIDGLMESGRKRGLDARRAEAGEFTARAYLNGRIDLTQAEGVAATIAAQSDAELAAARLLITGRLGAFAHGVGDDLAAALALVEAGIDFTDQDDVVAIAPGDLHDRLVSLTRRLHHQLARAVGIEQLRAIPWVALVGRPNAGKSALFNALLGRERAVVSPVAGTTRDVLAEPLRIETDHGPAEVMLVDLAGLDDDDPSSMNRQMQAQARDALQRSELRLRCVPVDEADDPPATEAGPAELLVRTKADVPASTTLAGVAVSAFAGAGLDELRRAIAARLSDRAVSLSAGAIALQPRHEAAMRSALARLDEAIALIEPQRGDRALRDPELVAAAMRCALDELASLAGRHTPDDILGRIFANFCIGK